MMKVGELMIEEVNQLPNKKVWDLWEGEIEWMGQYKDKNYQSWIFTGRTDAEAKVLILWPPDAKSLLTAKDPDAGKDWRQKEKGVAEDELVG